MTAYDTIWEEALLELKKDLPDYHFKTFFINAFPFFEDHGVYYFEVHTLNEQNLLSKKYADKVRAAIERAYMRLDGETPDVAVVYLSPREAQDFRDAHRARYQPDEVEDQEKFLAELGPMPDVDPYAVEQNDPAEPEPEVPEDQLEPDPADDPFEVGADWRQQEPPAAVSQNPYAPPESPPAPAVPPARQQAVPAPPPAPAYTPAGSETAQLDPRHTFGSFVVGESNKFASAAAHAVADSPGCVYNPLFLYGGVGLGKTHLMHAIGNQIRQSHPEKKIVYVTSETFTNELISMIRSTSSMDRRQEFRNKYRKADVLMIDDIQFIAGKDTTQDEFFHTFNELHGDHKQIIISSDRPPKDLNQLEERMRSRFEWGLIADIQLPDYETRVAILQQKASERPDMLPMDNDVFYYMAEQPNENIRSLEGALTRVNMYAELHQASRIDVSLAKAALQELYRSKQHHTVSPEQVVSVVCEYFGVPEEEVLGSRRTKDVAFARQVAMYIIRQLTELPLSKIAAHFHKKDHTTVIHAEKVLKKAMKDNAGTKREVDDVIARLRST